MTDMDPRRGQVQVDGAHASLHFVRRLRHGPERVWAALTDPAELKRWYMAQAEIDGRLGGSVAMTSGPAQFVWTGRILTWEPPRVFAYEFNAAPRPELPEGETTIVRWELVAHGDETELRLTHTRLTRPTASGFAPGTHALLDRLEAQLAGAPLPGFVERYAEVQALYPRWAGA